MFQCIIDRLPSTKRAKAERDKVIDQGANLARHLVLQVVEQLNELGIINQGEDCYSLDQIKDRIKAQKEAPKSFEIVFDASIPVDVQRVANVVLYASGWETEQVAEDRLVLTYFDRYDPDRVFILRGSDHRKHLEVRRSDGHLPTVPSFDEILTPKTYGPRFFY